MSVFMYYAHLYICTCNLHIFIYAINVPFILSMNPLHFSPVELLEKNCLMLGFIPPYEHSFPHVNKVSVEVFLQYILTASAKDAVRGDFTSTDSKRNYLTISHWDEAVL